MFYANIINREMEQTTITFFILMDDYSKRIWSTGLWNIFVKILYTWCIMRACYMRQTVQSNILSTVADELQDVSYLVTHVVHSSMNNTTYAPS